MCSWSSSSEYIHTLENGDLTQYKFIYVDTYNTSKTAIYAPMIIPMDRFLNSTESFINSFDGGKCSVLRNISNNSFSIAGIDRIAYVYGVK